MTIEEMRSQLEVKAIELKGMQERLEKIMFDNHELATKLRKESQIVEGKIIMLNEMTPVQEIEPLV